jgi:hypothetical protein
MMAPQDLESELKKEPFQPFRIVTTRGKTYARRSGASLDLWSAAARGRFGCLDASAFPAPAASRL